MFRNPACLCATLFALAAATVLLTAEHAAAQQAAGTGPQCKGRDLRPELAKRGAPPLEEVAAKSLLGKNTGAVLWKVEKEGLPASYLFGTIHSSDPKLLTLPGKVAAALGEVSTVAVEIRDGSDAMVAGMMAGEPQKFFYTGAENLGTHLTPDEVQRGQDMLKVIGLPFTQLKPWFALASLALPACEVMRAQTGAKVLDGEIERRAVAAGKTVMALETPFSQISAFIAVPEADAIAMLKATLAADYKPIDQFETLKLMYLERKIAEIWAMSLVSADLAGVPRTRFDAFRRELLEKRNVGMIKAAQKELAAGGIMIAVGALHLPGDKGLVELAREQGFKVTAVE